MPRLKFKSWFEVLLACLPVIGLAVLYPSSYFRVWSYHDYFVFQEVQEYPAGDDFWFGRIKAGQDLSAFVAEHPPHRTRRVGDFTVLSYYSTWPLPPMSIPFESLTVIAKDGRLVEAAVRSCAWNREFFTMSQEDLAELEKLGR